MNSEWERDGVGGSSSATTHILFFSKFFPPFTKISHFPEIEACFECKNLVLKTCKTCKKIVIIISEYYTENLQRECFVPGRIQILLHDFGFLLVRL